MKFLCLMGLFPKEYENTVVEDTVSGEIQFAASKLQWAVAEGLSRQEGAEVHILNAMFVGSYPRKYKKLRIPTFPFQPGENATGLNVGFLNLPFVKMLSKYWAVRREALRWIRENRDQELVVVAYAMTSPWVELLHHIADAYPGVTCLLIVPDLPEYMSVGNRSGLYRFMKKIHIAHMRRNLDSVDGYVLLTEHMKDWFGAPVAYTVVEGIYGARPEEHETPETREKVILYSGGICEAYGIGDLVDAFCRMDAPGWKLELIGDGDMLEALKERARTDERLLIRGSMPNRQVLERQRRVSILVNPRSAGQDFTRYSFPSKTIEYMASGTPMLGYRLPGIPREYCDFFVQAQPGPDGLRQSLEQMVAMSPQDREEMGRRAREFILENKNAKAQCAKLVRLAESIKRSGRD